MSLEFREQNVLRRGTSFRLLATASLKDCNSLEWVAFIGHRQLSGDDFLQAIQWAESFPTQKAILLTPYHSPIEKEVARIVLRKGGRVMIVLARAPLKRVPGELLAAIETEQAIFVTSPEWKNPRPTRDRCLARNHLIRSLSDEAR